jgi:hypothetical protein
MARRSRGRTASHHHAARPNTTVSVTFTTRDWAVLAHIAAKAVLTPEDTLRVALWNFGRRYIDVPPGAFPLGGKLRKVVNRSR